MTFLNPLALLGLAAATIPLLLHLLQRRKLRVVEFSSVRFLSELQRTHIRRVKLRQLILLILRTSLILLTVLAFSRPALREHLPWTPAAESPGTAILLIDNSPSMARSDEGGLYFRQAKEQAGTLLELLNDGDDISVAPFSELSDASSETLLRPTRSRATARRLIDNLTLSPASADMRSVAAHAADAARTSSTLKSEVYLFSDFQTGLLPSRVQPALPSARTAGTHARYFLFPIGPPATDNVSIDTAVFRTSIFQAGRPVEVEARIHNRSPKIVPNRLVSAFLEGSRVAQRAVDLPAEASVVVPLTFIPSSTGFLSGFLDLETDGFEADNRWFFTFYVPDRLRVLLVGSPEDIRFPRLALQSSAEGTAYLRTSDVRAASLQSSHLLEADVVVLANAAQYASPQVEALKAFLAAGGGLLVFPGSATDISYWNNILAVALDLPPAESVQSFATGASEFAEQGVGIEKSELRHPLFQGMFEEASSPASARAATSASGRAVLESPRVYRALHLLPRPGDFAPLVLSSGAPFLVESSSGRVLIFCTGTLPEWSDFARTGLFVPLLHQAVASVTRRQSIQQSVEVASDVNLRIPGSARGTLTVVDPERREVILPGPSSEYITLPRSMNQQAGNYRLFSGKEGVASFSANVSRRESDLRRAQTRAIIDALAAAGIPDESVQILDEGEDARTFVARLRHGTELWKFLLGAALVVGVIEVIVARDSRKAEESIIKGNPERSA